MATTVARREQPLHAADRHAWLQRQAELARTGRTAELDLANIAEELRDMAAGERRELRSRLTTLIMHLLKYQLQPRARSRSWRGTIAEQRTSIEDAIFESPSLGAHLDEIFADPRCNANAVRRAAAETALAADGFPERCPYSLQNVLDHDFWPGPGPHPAVTPSRGRNVGV